MWLIKNHHHASLKSQTGAVLLALMLVLIVGSSFFLVTKLNTNLAKTRQDEQTGIALSAAKNALIGYAITFPDHDNSGVVDGPGYLPCPDLNKDGNAVISCSAGGNTTIGRLPHESLRLEELRDASGQRLWYALSENFRFGNNKTIPLNSESPSSAELSVNGTGDIVAVIIAPGEPVGVQNRDPAEIIIANEIANYLEDGNADLNTAFTTNAVVNFNDRLMVITRQELMEAVEKRVMGEVSQFLTTYYNTYGAYPWLMLFADPKASKRPLSGEHNGGNGSATLIDSSRNFIEWGVANGDIVRNFTDGSIGTVTAVTQTTLTIAGPLLGTENDYDDDDEYYIYPAAFSNQLMGIATNINDNDSLEDTNNDFDELDITPGDIVDNLTDGCSGVIDTVAQTELTFLSLIGCVNDDFDNGDNYIIRNHQGQATAGSNSLTLEDTNNDFVVMGVQVGDMIVNITDGSIGRVSVIDAAVPFDTLTIEELSFGADNTFEVNDYYSLPRYNTNNNTREGLLAFHEVGKYFPTAFNIDWNFAAAAAADVNFDAATYPGVQPTYSTAVENHLDTYAENGGTQSFDQTEGTCNWIIATVADCYGSYLENIVISGTVTSGSSTAVLTDANATFVTDGVKRGDIVQNYDDEFATGINGTADVGSAGMSLFDAAADFITDGVEAYHYLIHNSTTNIRGVITEVIDEDTLTAVEFDNQAAAITFSLGDAYTIYTPGVVVVTDNPVAVQTVANTTRATIYNPDFDLLAGPYEEYYRIITAADLFNGIVDTMAGSTLTDADGDFITKGIIVGDIIYNSTDGSYGEISAVTATTVTATLYGGTNNIFTPSDNYVIYYNYVYSRRHDWHVRFSANQETRTLSEKKVRDVCLGYAVNDCSTITAAVNFTGNGGVPLVTIRDYTRDGVTEVGKATLNPSAASSGVLKISDIDYYLSEAIGEIPDWFVTNKWYQLIHVAYSADDSPNGGAICAAGTDCLILTGGGTPNNNKRALVISAGSALTTQDRTSSLIGSYYENQNNTAGDDNFQTGGITGTFNDQTRILDTSP